MIRHQRRRAPALADLAHARRQAAADRPAIAAVGHGDERIVPDPEWDTPTDIKCPWHGLDGCQPADHFEPEEDER